MGLLEYRRWSIWIESKIWKLDKSPEEEMELDSERLFATKNWRAISRGSKLPNLDVEMEYDAGATTPTEELSEKDLIRLITAMELRMLVDEGALTPHGELSERELWELNSQLNIIVDSLDGIAQTKDEFDFEESGLEIRDMKLETAENEGVASFHQGVEITPAAFGWSTQLISRYHLNGKLANYPVPNVVGCWKNFGRYHGNNTSIQDGFDICQKDGELGHCGRRAYPYRYEKKRKKFENNWMSDFEIGWMTSSHHYQLAQVVGEHGGKLHNSGRDRISCWYGMKLVDEVVIPVYARIGKFAGVDIWNIKRYAMVGPLFLISLVDSYLVRRKVAPKVGLCGGIPGIDTSQRWKPCADLRKLGNSNREFICLGVKRTASVDDLVRRKKKTKLEYHGPAAEIDTPRGEQRSGVSEILRKGLWGLISAELETTASLDSVVGKELGGKGLWLSSEPEIDILGPWEYDEPHGNWYSYRYGVESPVFKGILLARFSSQRWMECEVTGLGFFTTRGFLMDNGWRADADVWVLANAYIGLVSFKRTLSSYVPMRRKCRSKLNFQGFGWTIDRWMITETCVDDDIWNSAHLVVGPEGVQMVLLARLSLCWSRWMEVLLPDYRKSQGLQGVKGSCAEDEKWNLACTVVACSGIERELSAWCLIRVWWISESSKLENWTKRGFPTDNGWCADADILLHSAPYIVVMEYERVFLARWVVDQETELMMVLPIPTTMIGLLDGEGRCAGDEFWNFDCPIGVLLHPGNMKLWNKYIVMMLDECGIFLLVLKFLMQEIRVIGLLKAMWYALVWVGCESPWVLREGYLCRIFRVIVESLGIWIGLYTIDCVLWTTEDILPNLSRMQLEVVMDYSTFAWLINFQGINHRQIVETDWISGQVGLQVFADLRGEELCGADCPT